MSRAPQILIALLVLLPVASWLTTTGGLPACCRGSNCPMAMHGSTLCPMAAGTVAMGQPRCAMSAATQLSLPASLFPVMPLPRRVHGLTSWLRLRSFAAAVIPLPSSGFPLALFHPPCV